MIIRIIDNCYKNISICIVETRKGYQYATDWANEYDEKGILISPTIEQVKDAWREDRRSFLPYCSF